MKTQLPPALFSSSCDDGDSLCLDSDSLGKQAHICAFFQSADEEYEVLLPYIRKGLELGQKAVHTIEPRRLEEHSRRLTTAGIPLGAKSLLDGQFALYRHLRIGSVNRSDHSYALTGSP